MRRSLIYFLSGSLISAVCVFVLFSTVLVERTTVTDLPDGSTYIGERNGHLLHGEGRLEWPNGSSYEGQFVDGKIEGQGLYISKEGETYEGEFLAGMFHGQGIYTTADKDRYEGMFVNDSFTGQGAFYYQGGSVYQGEFQDWIYEGEGALTHADGEKFTGDYKDGSLNGLGEHFSADGDHYKGEFKQGYYHGEGEYKSEDGSVYTGEFASGYYHGEGNLFAANGDHYVGHFRYGDYHGEGTLTYGTAIDGIEQLSGEWDYGELSTCHDTCNILSEQDLTEQALYNQNQLIAEQLNRLNEANPEQIDLYFLGVAGYGSEAVFRREVLFVQNQFDELFNTKGRSAVLVNDRSTVFDYPLATKTSLKMTLAKMAERMDEDEDILFLFMSSHGSKSHEFSLNVPGFSLGGISAEELANLVKPLSVKHKVIVISSCYSGGHIPYLEDEHTLILTAAGADKTSFGCSDRNLFTYFGEAFFKEALPESDSFIEAFNSAKAIVTAREENEEFEPSLPQISKPDAIVEYLKRWRREMLDQSVKVASNKSSIE